MNIPEFLKKNVALLQDFSDECLQELARGSRLDSFEANEAVAHCGDEVSHFSVVLSGSVSASALGDGGTRKVLGQVKPGGTFGELALMTGDKLLADFIAENSCQVLRIPVSLFQGRIMSEPGAVKRLSRTITERMQEVLSDPAKAAAALQKGRDPYGLKLKGERPEKILVLNCGSSSVKYSFYDTEDESKQARGGVERIGLSGTRLVHKGPRGDVKRELPSGSFTDAFAAIVKELTSSGDGSYCVRERCQHGRASRRPWRREIYRSHVDHRRGPRANRRR